jgi:hypothetical protein
MKRFRFLTGDVNWQTYGGKWYRKASEGQYHIIELTNMDECCGRDNEGQPTYCVDLSLIDLTEIPVDAMTSALCSCGLEDRPLNLNAWDTWTENDRLMLVECLHSYGTKAPLWQDSGNAYAPLLQQARAESHALDNDEAMTAALDRPVNRLGSTAAEFMRGDLDSALLRGLIAGNQEARLVAKIRSGGKITDAELDACVDK